MLSVSFYSISISNGMCIVLLFGSVERIAVNLRIKVANGSSCFRVTKNSVLIWSCIIICKNKIKKTQHIF